MDFLRQKYDIQNKSEEEKQKILNDFFPAKAEEKKKEE